MSDVAKTVKSRWMWILGAVLLGAGLLIGAYNLGRSTGSADVNAALAKYNELRTADDKYIGSALGSVKSALAESDRLSQSGSYIEATVRSISVLVNAVRDCITELSKAEALRGSGSPAGGTGGTQ
jgi:hypothetical protein